MCLKERLTNKEIATRLAANPATALHHVRKLVAAGFLVALPTRTGANGALEVPYEATGKSWRLNLDARDLNLRIAMIDAFVSEVGQVPATVDVEISRLGVRLTDEEHDKLLRLIREYLDEVAVGEPAEGSTPYSIFVAVHPDLPRD